jgi:hypothetical protein
MEMIADCPICGKQPKKKVFKPEYEFGGCGKDIITITCCGMECDFTSLWNRYAAAMELARATVGYRDYGCIDALKPATQRVIEVFGGK